MVDQQQKEALFCASPPAEGLGRKLPIDVEKLKQDFDLVIADIDAVLKQNADFLGKYSRRGGE